MNSNEKNLICHVCTRQNEKDKKRRLQIILKNYFEPINIMLKEGECEGVLENNDSIYKESSIEPSVPVHLDDKAISKFGKFTNPIKKFEMADINSPYNIILRRIVNHFLKPQYALTKKLDQYGYR